MIDLHGNVEIIVYEREKPIQVVRKHNRFVVTGLNGIRDLMIRVGIPPNLIAFGDDNSDTTDLMASLNHEVYRAPINRITVSEATAIFWTYIAESEANGLTFREIGLFGGWGVTETPPPQGGIMYARTPISDIVKTSDRSVTVSWTVQISAKF